jgi:hypothetical protein
VAAAPRSACCSGAAGTSRASLGLLCPCCRVRSATARLAVEAVPSRTAVVVLLPALLPHRSASGPCADDHSATTRLTQDRGGACSWAASWVELDGLCGMVVFFGGREKSLSAGPTPWRRCLRVSPLLPEGPRLIPLSHPLRIPGETLGLVRATAASSSHPFLKVLLWYAAIRSARRVVGIFRRAQRLRANFV